MISRLSVDTHIPPTINQQAAIAGVGSPIQAFRVTWLRIFSVIILIVLIACIAWVGFTIYAYFTFVSLTHIYPNIADIPSNQLDYYSWMQTFHDNFWNNLWQAARSFLTFLSLFFVFGISFNTQMYLCSEGLLSIKKGKVQSIRWDEVEEFHTSGGTIRSLLSKNKTSLALPKGYFLLKKNRAIGAHIIEEITRIQLPHLLEQFDRGETISLGTLQANKTGVSRTGVQLPWSDIAVTELDNRYLKIYGYQPRHIYDKKALRWYSWANDITPQVHSLPLFAAVVNAMLAREQSSVQQDRIQSWKTMAATAKRLQKRRTLLLVGGTIALIICLLAGLTFSLISYSNQQDQRAARDLKLIQNGVKKLAQHPYYASVPGAKCDQGQGNWVEDDTNTYDCLPDGLFMIQKNMQYQDEIYFDFDKATDATTDPGLLFTGQFVPHHYQLQVKATMVSGGPDTCVSIHFHIYQFMGRQEFDVCADNTWSYSYCDLQCDKDVQVASGNLPQNETSPYLITIDVTDTIQTLYVDHTKIASMKDSRYTRTDNIALGVYGDEDGTPGAVFSDFRYTPFTQP